MAFPATSMAKLDPWSGVCHLCESPWRRLKRCGPCRCLSLSDANVDMERFNLLALVISQPLQQLERVWVSWRSNSQEGPATGPTLVRPIQGARALRSRSHSGLAANPFPGLTGHRTRLPDLHVLLGVMARCWRRSTWAPWAVPHPQAFKRGGHFVFSRRRASCWFFIASTPGQISGSGCVL